MLKALSGPDNAPVPVGTELNWKADFLDAEIEFRAVDRYTKKIEVLQKFSQNGTLKWKPMLVARYAIQVALRPLGSTGSGVVVKETSDFNIYGSTFAAPKPMQYHGYYYLWNGNPSDLSLAPQAATSSNLVFDNFYPNLDYNKVASELRTFHQRLILNFSYNGDLSDPAPVRMEYYKNLKKKIGIDSDLINQVDFISMGEEWYSLYYQGNFRDWKAFQPDSPDLIALGWQQTMKKVLEDNIAMIKQVFPGIPVLIVENYWNKFSSPPPANLDVLGIDSYYIPTSNVCDATQKAKFDSEVIPAYQDPVTVSKPILMVGGAFQYAPWRMPSPCQIEWYYQYALSQPSVIGIEWFTYGGTTPTYLGLTSPGFEAERAYIATRGQQVLKR
jgi:hypothetical protein